MIIKLLLIVIPSSGGKLKTLTYSTFSNFIKYVQFFCGFDSYCSHQFYYFNNKMAESSGSHSYLPVSHDVGKIGDKIASKGKVLKCFEEFKALKPRKIDDVSYTGTVLGMND